jgi:hypothetical protein
MTSTLPKRWMLLLGAGISVACGGTVSRNGDYAPRPNPPPGSAIGGCPLGAPPSNAKELEACLRTLRFDSDALAGDEQPLMVLDKSGSPCPGDRSRSCRYGPLARIEPVVGAHEYTERELRDGRIIARLSLGPKETESYEKFGLSPGLLTYWWVQKDASGTTGRSVYVTMTKGERLTAVERTLEVYPYHGDSRIRVTRALARWIWDADDEKTAGSCGSASSCK